MTMTLTAPTTQVLTRDSHNTLVDQFAKWLFAETTRNGSPNGKIISAEKCASKIASLRLDGRDITVSDARAMVSDAREYFEKNLNCTIWPVRGVGWRASTEIETAIYFGKTIRKTIAWAERTRRIGAITKRKYIPHTIRAVVGKAEGGINSLSNQRREFLEKYGIYQKQEKELNSENTGQKFIEAPKK